ncbi:unnamed protein product [Moneuplotes crassus]|uniref:TOG domain-containing protein n=1 Tax=Euplotes crassus TaxID=5936 RepID=A0AAD2CWE3_EUPCR|nr:unnamed protein product [Moneuplotes crassus]
MLSELRSTKNPSEAFSSSKSFLNLVENLLEHHDCVHKVLQIVGILVKESCFKNVNNLTTIFGTCKKFLGGESLDIRREAMKLFIALIESMPSKIFVEQALSYAHNDNWKVKEEILNLLIICLIKGIDKSLNIEHTVSQLAILVADDHSKVRFVAREACAMLALKGKTEKIMNTLGNLVIHNEYLKIKEIIEKNNFVTFNESKLMFEYPKKPKSLKKIKLNQPNLGLKGISKIKLNFSKRKIRNLELPQGSSGSLPRSKKVEKSTKTIRNRKIKMRNKPSNTALLSKETSKKRAGTRKISSNSSEALSPNNQGDNSTLNYTDYILSKKISSSFSPGRLRALKQTMRTKNSSKQEGNNFSNEIQNRRGIGASHRLSKISATQTSLHSINLHNRMEETSDTSGHIHESHFNTKSMAEKMNYSEYINLSETATQYESSGFSKRMIINRERKNQTQTRKNTKKMDAAAQACISRLLCKDSELENEGKYMRKEDIQKLKSPSKALKTVFKDLTCSDWKKQFDACNSLRALVLHHKEILLHDSYILQCFMQGMVKQVESLRSSIAKNALIAFKDVIEVLKKRLDNDLDYIMPAVMKKAAEKNTFLAKVATDLLISAAKSCSEHKVMSALGSLTFKKSPTIRVRMLIVLKTVVMKLGAKILKFKDNISIMSYLTSFLQDASEKVREKSKEALETLKQTLGNKFFEKLIKNTCNDKQELKIYRIFQTDKIGALSETAHSMKYLTKKHIRNERCTNTTHHFPQLRNQHTSPSNAVLESVPESEVLKRKIASVIRKPPNKLAQ